MTNEMMIIGYLLNVCAQANRYINQEMGWEDTYDDGYSKASNLIKDSNGKVDLPELAKLILDEKGSFEMYGILTSMKSPKA